MINNTRCLTIGLKWPPDEAFAQHTNWPPPGSIRSHRLNHQRTGGKSIQISKITTPTQWRLAVHFGCQISPTGGDNKRNHTQSMLISPTWHEIYSLSYHTVLEWRPVFPLGEMVLAAGSRKPLARPFVTIVIVRQFAWANKGILAGHDPTLHVMNRANNTEMKRDAEERKWPWMAKIHNFLEMWQGWQNLHATQKESRAQNKRMTAVGYISDTEEIFKASWSLFSHDGAAAFQLSERSPLPPALSAKALPGRRTQISNVHQIRWINRHPVESNENSPPDNISDTSVSNRSG